jgi:hypothetical protein
MAGLVPAIHVDPRDKPGDDEQVREARGQIAPPASPSLPYRSASCGKKLAARRRTQFFEPAMNPAPGASL